MSGFRLHLEIKNRFRGFASQEERSMGSVIGYRGAGEADVFIKNIIRISLEFIKTKLL